VIGVEKYNSLQQNSALLVIMMVSFNGLGQLSVNVTHYCCTNRKAIYG